GHRMPASSPRRGHQRENPSPRQEPAAHREHPRRRWPAEPVVMADAAQGCRVVSTRYSVLGEGGARCSGTITRYSVLSTRYSAVAHHIPCRRTPMSRLCKLCRQRFVRPRSKHEYCWYCYTHFFSDEVK